ncbi:MAG: hypothetical protein H6810_03375 [Phycisphaeraceae bacterium]|nr:MAG: hypothetical protein H6810_03375 [Phycisphaeraceae bacterium]
MKNHSTRPHGLATAASAIAIAALAAPNALAAPAVYEGFDIAFDEYVGPGTGSSGFGWAGDWAAALSVDATDGPKGQGATGSWGPDQDGTPPDNLDFDGYTSGGFTTGRSVRKGTGAGVASITRSLNTSAIAPGLIEGGELWFSMLVEIPGYNTGFGVQMGATGFDPDTKLPTGDDTQRGYGFQIRTVSGAMNMIARGWKGGGFIGGGAPEIPVAQNEEFMVIVRYQILAGADAITVYKVSENDSGLDLAQLPSSTFSTGMAPADFAVMTLYDEGNTRFDELRVATLAPGGDPQDGLNEVAPGMGLTYGAIIPDQGLYEGFDIPFNQPVGPGDGSSGTGWLGDWELTLSLDGLQGPTGRGAGESWGPDQDGTPPDNLDFNGYTDGGYTTGRSVKRLDATGTSALTRPFDPTALAGGLFGNGELWASVLVKLPSNNTELGLGLGATAFDPDTKRPFGTVDDKTFGFQIRTVSGAMNMIARGWKGGGFVGAGAPSIPVAIDEEFLIVMRYEIGGGTDRLTVWKVLETDTGAYLVDLPSSVFDTGIDPNILGLLAQYNVGNTTWDELRYASIGSGGDPEACLDAVAPGMNLDIAPLPDLAYNADSADLYEPFDMNAGESVSQQGSGKGWGEAAPGNPSGASRWAMNSTGDEQMIRADAISFPAVPLFGSPELVFNGRTAQRPGTSGASSITREIDPELASKLFQEGGETWISLALDFNERDPIVVPVTGNNTSLCFANAPYGPNGYGNLPEGGVDTFGDYTGFGFRVTGTDEGVDTIIRPTCFFDGWKEGSDSFPPADATSTDWYFGDKIYVVMRVQWKRTADGAPTDLNGDMIPDDGTTDVVTLWRIVPEFAIGGPNTNLDTFPNQEVIQGEAYYGDPGAYPFGEIAIRNDQINMVSIAQDTNGAFDELRASYVRYGEQSQDALDRVAPGLNLSVSNTAEPPFPACNAADLAMPYGVLDLADIVAFVAAFQAQDPAADIDGNGLFDLADIGAFVTAFIGGCP